MAEDRMDWETYPVHFGEDETWAEYLARVENDKPRPVQPLSPSLQPITDGVFFKGAVLTDEPSPTFSSAPTLTEEQTANNEPSYDSPNPTDEEKRHWPFNRENVMPTGLWSRITRAWDNGLSRDLIMAARWSGLNYGTTRPAVFLLSNTEVVFVYSDPVPDTEDEYRSDEVRRTNLREVAENILDQYDINDVTIYVRRET